MMKNMLIPFKVTYIQRVVIILIHVDIEPLKTIYNELVWLDYIISD